MSIPVTLTYGPADPGCCVRTCQDVIDLIRSKLTGSIPDITSVIISPNQPDVADRDKLWVKTDSVTGKIIDFLVWSADAGQWVSYLFDVDQLTPGDSCTVLATWQDKAQWRTPSDQIDCIPDGSIPCSKIDFGIVPDGCQNQTWKYTVKANQAAIDNGRIEFDVSWTSVTCGVGRRFVTQSPIVLDTNYDINVCLPSDAASITVTNLIGEEVNTFVNLTTNCDPPTCDNFNALIPIMKTAGPFVTPTTTGISGKIQWAHGLPGKPVGVFIRLRYNSSGGGTPSVGYNDGDEIDLDMVQSTDADNCYGFKWDATNVYVWGLKLGDGSSGPANAKVPNFDDPGEGEGAFAPVMWPIYITAFYRP